MSRLSQSKLAARMICSGLAFGVTFSLTVDFLYVRTLL
jgi:hypothetical protein